MMENMSWIGKKSDGTINENWERGFLSKDLNWEHLTRRVI